MNRPPHPPEVVARMRRERIAPRITQWDYLHLAALRRGLVRAFGRLPPPQGPTLDLWCGTKPYAPLVPGRVWGLDIDFHFASADVLGASRLPFKDAAFSWVLCTQALHILDDPRATVAEMRRVLAPGGVAIVTVPYAFLRVGAARMERRLAPADLAAMFDGWHDVQLHRIAGAGAALGHGVGVAADALIRRSPLPPGFLVPLVVPVNLLGMGLEALLAPLAHRWPHLVLLTARTPGQWAAPSATGSDLRLDA